MTGEFPEYPAYSPSIASQAAAIPMSLFAHERTCALYGQSPHDGGGAHLHLRVVTLPSVTTSFNTLIPIPDTNVRRAYNVAWHKFNCDYRAGGILSELTHYEVRLSRPIIVFMKHLLLAVAMIGMVGCATEGKFREQLQVAIGQDINSLIERLGPPTSTFDMPNGNKSYTWMHSNGMRSTASYNQYTGATAMTSAIYCQVSLITNSAGTVTAANYQGNACRAQ